MNADIDVLESTTFYGRKFSRKKLLEIQAIVETFPKLSLNELGLTICENLNWINERGKYKIQSCIKALEQMEKNGLFKLPEKDKTKQHRKKGNKSIPWTDKTEIQDVDISINLEEILPIKLKLATSKKDIELWNEYVDRYHYLRYKQPIGPHLRYFIISEKLGDKILGCLLFSATPVKALAARDNWIGWKKQDRSKRLSLILNNTRYLILPHVSIKYLSSKVLSIISKQVTKDWENCFGIQPVLLETFVDPEKYKGISYQSANWQYLGKTTGRKFKAGSDNLITNPKDIYVYPLRSDFREILKNEKKVLKRNKISSKKLNLESDDPFINLWQKIISIIYTVADKYNKKWQKRNRLINTILIILFIFRLVFSKNKQGYQTTINELWEHCHNMKFPLPQYNPPAASAFCEARKKLDENIFKTLNSEIIKTYEAAEKFSWKEHKVFAVDGSNINLPHKLIAEGYKTPSITSHYPQGKLSCIYQLKSQVPHDFDLVSHNDERKVAIEHLKTIEKDDLVVYDRGYFSYVMLHSHLQQKKHAVFRLQQRSYEPIDKFIKSNETDEIVSINPSKWTCKEIKSKNPDIKIIPLKLRLVKYKVSETTYILGTTLYDNKKYTISELSDLYHSRWGIEELYKISKQLIEVEDFHSQTERGVKQELYAHFVLITLNRIFSNKVENLFDNTNAAEKKEIKVNLKNSLVTISRNMEALFIEHVKLMGKAIKKIFQSIIRCKQKVRPNRKYERKSMKPINKWKPLNFKHCTT